MKASERIARHIRSNVVVYFGLFALATMGPALATAADEPEAGSSASAAKQVKKLKKKLRSVEARLAALEAKPAPAIPAAPAIPTTLPPSGAAGGDLAGSYPSPQIRAGRVGRAELADSIDVGGGASLAVGGPGVFGLPTWDGVLLQAGAIDFRENSGGTSIIRSDGTAFFAGNVTTDQLSPSTIRLIETGEPAAPGINQGVIFLREAVGGNTELAIKWRDNSIDVLAVGPVN